jgi:hypothetical protein
MNPFWSQIARELSPYVPGEQPRIANLVKLNTNESPFSPSPLALEAMRNAATDTLRLYPDPEATELREVLAAHHGVTPEQVFVGNGSDEVLAHTFVALLKQPKALLFPDVTYSFYPVWAQLFGLAPVFSHSLDPKRSLVAGNGNGEKCPLTVTRLAHKARVDSMESRHETACHTVRISFVIRSEWAPVAVSLLRQRG